MVAARGAFDFPASRVFATLENPEPRYTVEIFPFLMILAGAGAALIKASAKATETDAVPMVE
jgi:hypothetical protein